MNGIDGYAGETVPTADIVASHIFQQRWANLVERRSGIEINDPANIILMHKKVEKKFDSFELTVMPSTYTKLGQFFTWGNFSHLVVFGL